MERRKFITSGVRWLMAAGLITMSGYLIVRRKISLKDCYPGSSCSACARNVSCIQVIRNKKAENGKG